jgi:polyisoprenoid-binding protein YceI
MTTETWNIDASHSSIHFSIRHLVIAKVRGQFTKWSGAFTVDGTDFTTAQVSATIDSASIETGVADRDKHLKSADFFDVATFPEITFKSTRVEGNGKEHWKLIGDLTIHGVTREITLQVEHSGGAKDPWGNQRLGFAAKTSIERKEFGLTWNQVLEAGGVMVGDRVDIEIDLEAVHQAAKAA